ncbi:MAG: AMP-binding protein, partial [Candidatus Aminicenantes bacterium]
MGKKNKRIQNVYRLSPMQEGMLFHSLLEKESHAYVEQNVFSIKGEIDSTRFEESFNVLIRRYDIFRTVFFYDNLDEPLQIVLKERKYKMPVEDITHLTEDQKHEYLEAFKEKDRDRGFDLSKDLLMRIFLFKTGADSYKLVWTFHHIIMDGWCLGIIFKDWVRVYEGLKRGESPRLEPVIQYENYIDWLDHQEKTQGLNYWKNYLEGYDQQTTFPKPGNPVKVAGNDKYRLEKHCFVLYEPLSCCLMELARKNRVTLNILFRAIWGILLQRYNNTDDVVFGAVVSGRPAGIEGIENMVGLFINTVPVRVKVKTKPGTKNSFHQLLKTLHQEALLSKAREYLPLAEIQANSLLKGHLIDHIMAFENYPVRETIKHIGIEQSLGFSIQGMESFEQTNYNFNIIVAPGKTIHVEFSFNSLIYRSDFIKRTALHFKEIVSQVTENSGPDVDIGTIEILTEEEKRQILFDFNDTYTEYPREKTIPGLFAEQAEKTPDNTALLGGNSKFQIPNSKHGVPCGQISNAFGGAHLTYRELNRESHRLAHLLREKGVGPDTVVGLMVERSLEMIVGILGILKAGGAYLPIDPDYPEERINFMLADSKVQLLLIDNPSRHFNCQLSIVNCQLSINEKTQPATVFSNPQTATRNWQLAYVIYTSGTTGEPKGTLTTHLNVIRVVKNCNYIDLKAADRILQLSNYAFDGSVFDIYGALLNGAALVMIEREKVLAVDQLAEVIKKEQITVFFVTTALFNALLDLEIDCFANVRKVLFGGEKVSAAHSGKALKYLGKNRIIHVYGPTETTVYATYYFINQIDETLGTIPIGKPISNTTVYILDKY